MGIKYTPRKTSTAKIPATEFAPKTVVQLAIDTEVYKVLPGDAVLNLLNANPGVLARHGKTITGDYPIPGQSIAAFRKRASELVETDQGMYDFAVAAGLPVDNPRPAPKGGTT